jgi:hypothetical protein
MARCALRQTLFFVLLVVLVLGVAVTALPTNVGKAPAGALFLNSTDALSADRCEIRTGDVVHCRLNASTSDTAPCW